MSTSVDLSKNLTHSLKLTPDQNAAIDFVIGGDHTLLIADTGEGKTSICLHAIKHYIDTSQVTQCIVACPASVVSHWPAEAKKWGLNLDVVSLEGSPEQRKKLLVNSPQVLVVSLNNLAWLLDHNPPAEMIIVDELTKAAGKQTRKLRNTRHKEIIKIRVGMTATPVSENFEKLYAMARVIDNGAALGRTVEGYMGKYFTALDYKGYRHKLNDGAAAWILSLLDHMLYNINSNKKKELPLLSEKTITFDMPTKTRDRYDTMKKDMLIEFGNTADAVAPNRAVVSTKCRQLASGFVINEESEVVQFDNERAAQVRQWIFDLGSKTGVVLYQYNHQLAQLKQLLGGLSIGVEYVHGGSDKQFSLAQFKEGYAQILVAQELTLSHGVDGLQHCCADLLFMQEPWSADVRLQAIGRLFRKGQTKPTTVTTLQCRGSIDSLVSARHDDKAVYMKLFLAHLKGTK